MQHTPTTTTGWDQKSLRQQCGEEVQMWGLHQKEEVMCVCLKHKDEMRLFHWRLKKSVMPFKLHKFRVNTMHGSHSIFN